MTAMIMTTALRDYLERNDLAAIRVALEHEHAADLVAYIADMAPGEAAQVIGLLPIRRQAEVFGYLDPEAQVAVAHQFGRTELARVITAMHHDERADLFNRLSQEQQEAILPGIAQAEREDIRRLASYAEGTAGSVMTSDYAALPPELTVRGAIAKLRREAPDKETIYESYVVDDRRRLIGVVSLRDLLLARDEARVRDVMRTDVISARAEDSREEAARLIAHYDLLALPIVNGGDMLVGIVTQDDAMDVQEEEATLDFHKKGAVGRMMMSVRDASIWALYRARIVWLVVLVFGNIFSGAGIAVYEETIAAYVALVFFLPLLIGSGGNAGSQAATLMVRALATDDVHLGDWGRLIGREVLVAGLLGLTMALAVSVIGVFYGGLRIAAIVSASMVLIVLVGSTIGLSLPFVLSRLKLDPAAASAPLITSVADVVGVLIYFFIATSFLPEAGAG